MEQGSEDDIVDLEEFAKAGKKPPQASRYRFKVNDTVVVWDAPTITGREVLTAAGLVPPEDYSLRIKIRGEQPRKVQLEETIDLRQPGIEKFRAIRGGQQEGECQSRRDVALLPQDQEFLDRLGLKWEVVRDGSIWVLIHDFPLPEGYNTSTVTVAIRLEGGYPITALDMMYVYPPLARADGKCIAQVQVYQSICGRQFQRWSRHRTALNPWVPGQDSLETHIYFIEESFRAEFNH